MVTLSHLACGAYLFAPSRGLDPKPIYSILDFFFSKISALAESACFLGRICLYQLVLARLPSSELAWKGDVMPAHGLRISLQGTPLPFPWKRTNWFNISNLNFLYVPGRHLVLV